MTSSMVQNPYCNQKELGPGLTKSGNLDLKISTGFRESGSSKHKMYNYCIYVCLFVIIRLPYLNVNSTRTEAVVASLYPQCQG